MNCCARRGNVCFIVATITVTSPWKRPKLTVMQQAPSRYYGNATRCTDHVTTENLICHIIIKFDASLFS
jgi:hypothetical protein